ncbi:MAG: MFS transporter [Salinibacterium sp.]|nr:MFS transporter [Salinibacterium sp.]
MHTDPETSTGWAGRVAAMAIIAAVGVSIIYVPQPIQTLAADELGVPLAQSSAATVAVQAGYAIGVVFLVSLGDRLIPRRQVSIQLTATAAAILIAAVAQDFTIFTVMMFVAGAAATVGQILVSAALRLAPPEVRAHTAAVLLGSFLIGLFTVRTVLGTFAEVLGWRTVLVGAAGLVVACIPLTLRFAPRSRPPGAASYLAIIASIPGIIAASRAVRLLTITHALGFSAFISVWSMVTLYGVTELGLTVTQTAAVGIAGLLGGAATIASARLQGVLGTRRALPISLGALIVGCVGIAAFTHSVPVVLVGLFLVSFGMSSSQVSSQANALASVEPAESGRANTVFMATTFFAGAGATAIADMVMRWAGYAGVGVFALILALGSMTMALIAAGRKTV